jgi:hypothetical protein
MTIRGHRAAVAGRGADGGAAELSAGVCMDRLGGASIDWGSISLLATAWEPVGVIVCNDERQRVQAQVPLTTATLAWFVGGGVRGVPVVGICLLSGFSFPRLIGTGFSCADSREGAPSLRESILFLKRASLRSLACVWPDGCDADDDGLAGY